MFLEEKVRTAGWIEVVSGSMFSGKTEELIRRMKRAEIAKQKIIIFKPKVDTRYSEEMVVSHDAKSIKSIPVKKAEDILDLANGYEVIGIDEAQFFSDILVEVCNRLADRGIRVIVAGLDMDFAGKPFGPIPRLMAIAEYVSKVHAICMRCGNLAQYSHRLSDSDKQFLLGEKDVYEPLCRKCYNEAIKKQIIF